jgi:hypothetical protein
MTGNVRFTRSLAILRLKRRMEREAYPRVQMAFIVALTGAFAWLSSFGLLHAGIESMAMRYPLALTCAYLFFIFLLWLWLRTKASDYGDIPDFSGSADGSGSVDPVLPNPLGGGGHFGGGGAAGSFDSPAAASIADSDSLSAVGDVAGTSLQLDELAIPIAAIAMAVGLAFASLYVIYIAPALFSELIFDGLLSYTLYRRLRKSEESHWLSGALRHTAAPFALTALFLWATGVAMAFYAPGSHTLSEAVHHASERH